jgi:RNA recognition motif-containing protein
MEVTQTTVMVRNVPCKYNQAKLVEELEEFIGDRWNFFYAPVSRKSQSCLGYAFINFRNPRAAADFKKRFEGYNFKLQNVTRQKIATVSYSSIQGFEANTGFYRGPRVRKTKSYPLVRYDRAP